MKKTYENPEVEVVSIVPEPIMDPLQPSSTGPEPYIP